jgi:uncharacterized protein
VVSPVQSIVVWAHRRRGLVLCLAVLLVAFSLAGLRRLTFDADIISLLPREGRAISPFRTFLREFGSLDQLFIVFAAPDGHAIDEYSDEVDTWVAALRAVPEIEWVDTGTAGPDRDWGWLAEHQLLLMRGAALETALQRLTPDGMARALAASQQLLAVPSASVADLVRQDPLDLLGLLRRQLGGTRAGITIGVSAAGYVSSDGRNRLIIARPRRPPYDTDFSRRLLQQLDSVAAARSRARQASHDTDAPPPCQVSFAGGHLIALETEAVVKRESIWNSVGSLALILPLLLIVFRSVWLFISGALPSMASLLVVLGMLGLAGSTLSAAATGSAAMLFGLGVDGVVLMYVAHRIALFEGHRGEAAIAAIGSPAASMLFGMLTTAATFYGLVFVDFPSLQQLGLLIGHSMVACGLLTLVLIPALLPSGIKSTASLRPLAWPWLSTWIARRRRALLAGTVALTLLLGAAASQLRVNASLERLKSTTPAAANEERVRRTFGLPSDVYVVIQQGPELEPLLRENERMAAAVHKEAPSLAFDAASALLPSDESQARSRRAIRDAGPPPARALASFASASRAAGFRPGSLDPFVERLPKLLDDRQRLTADDYRHHGMSDLIGRFVVRDANAWSLASYAFPAGRGDLDVLQRAANPSGAQLTGLALVNEELASQFVPQFVRGITIGSVVVLVLLVLMFRNWRLSLLSTLPTVAGLVWAAGLLAIARVTLDLFAVFAVVTFVGIGIDYGIHLVHRYQDTGNAAEAVAELAPVIVVAGLITLLGYGTLITSTYPPLRSMGIVSIVSVFALVGASVLMLPALLMAPTRAAETEPQP